jgi:hypothetical protein
MLHPYTCGHVPVVMSLGQRAYPAGLRCSQLHATRAGALEGDTADGVELPLHAAAHPHRCPALPAGTLTRNVMEFFKCSVAGVSYGQGVTEVEKSNASRWEG